MQQGLEQLIPKVMGVGCGMEENFKNLQKREFRQGNKSIKNEKPHRGKGIWTRTRNESTARCCGCMLENWS